MDQTLTSALAIWGAVVSTALAARTLWRGRFEHGRLKPSVWVGRATSSRDGVRRFCSFSVVNAGVKPVYFGGLMLHDRNGEFIELVLGPVEGYDKLEPDEICETPDAHTYDDLKRIQRIHRIFAVDSSAVAFMSRAGKFGRCIERSSEPSPRTKN